MTLPVLLARLAVVVVAAVGVVTYLTVGPERLARVGRTLPVRLRATAPSFGVLLVVLAVNSVARRFGADVSWMIGWNLTGPIYALEGDFVATLQSLGTPVLTTYFAGVYVYGYVFLLVFPLVAYFALDELEPMRTTTLAYAVNYAVGLVCYLLFIAYGPRNLLPDLVDPLLYTSWPESKLLTSEVNVRTNVFPSLHTSLSVTVALLAHRTRDRYPGWFYLAVVLAASVVVSTMYLGIHWLTDVVAGVVLAVLSVSVATRVADPGTDLGPDTLPGRVVTGAWSLVTTARRRLSRGR